MVQAVYTVQSHLNEAFPPTQDISWSKTQLDIFQDPNMIQLQKALLDVWHVGKNDNGCCEVDNGRPIQFENRVRIGGANSSSSSGQGNAEVSGAGARDWVNRGYRNIYKHLFSLDTAHHFDPWRIEPHVLAAGFHGFR